MSVALLSEAIFTMADTEVLWRQPRMPHIARSQRQIPPPPLGIDLASQMKQQSPLSPRLVP